VRSERVLVWLKPQFLGDAVMATPLLDTLAWAFNRPDVSAGPSVRELLKDRWGLLQPVPAVASRRYREFWGHVRNLRAGRYDLAVLVNRSFRSALIVRFAGIKERIGHNCEWRAPLLTKAVPYDQLRAESECFLDLGRALGLAPVTTCIRLKVTDEERACGSCFGEGKWVGVQPGARNDWKLIPIDTLAAVTCSLREQGFRIALLGGIEERERATAFARAVGGEVLDLVGKFELRQTMGALTHLRLLLGADTGLMHVAAALNCPTLTLFGRVPASKWGHNYEPHVAMQAPGGDLGRVKAEDVAAAAEAILAATASATP
jgi:heptosyltransferase-2